MGNLAVAALLKDKVACATVYRDGKVTMADLQDCLRKKNEFDANEVELLNALSI